MTLKPVIYLPHGSVWSRIKEMFYLAYVNWHLRADEGKPVDWYVQIDQMEGE